MSRTTGPNFEIDEPTDGFAVVRVWRRPDLSRDEGARCAAELAGHMRRLAQSARGCLFDLIEATTTWGPATHAAISEMLGAWEQAARPIVVVPAAEAIQRLSLRELLRSAAPRQGRLVQERAAALSLLRRLAAKSA